MGQNPINRDGGHSRLCDSFVCAEGTVLTVRTVHNDSATAITDEPAAVRCDRDKVKLAPSVRHTVTASATTPSVPSPFKGLFKESTLFPFVCVTG